MHLWGGWASANRHGLVWPQDGLRSVLWVFNSPGTNGQPGHILPHTMAEIHEKKPLLTSQPQEFHWPKQATCQVHCPHPIIQPQLLS